MFNGSECVIARPMLRISPANLDDLISTLDVDFVRLNECLVSRGWRINLGGVDAPGIHYNLTGQGRMVLEGYPPIELLPHTLVITPPKIPIYIEMRSKGFSATKRTTIEGKWKEFPLGGIRRFVAGDISPQLMLICGYFRASYGISVDLFSALSMPIVEQFDAADQLGHTLKTVLAELVAQEIGTGAMTTSLVKQVLIALFRRSLTSINQWVECFSMLSDPSIAKAFAIMAIYPGDRHSILSLAQIACLSRSAFMARFTKLFGQAPMTVLRELRMRQATALLANDSLTIEQVAENVGYSSRDSFLRAFRKTCGEGPLDWLAARNRPVTSDQVEREAELITDQKLNCRNRSF